MVNPSHDAIERDDKSEIIDDTDAEKTSEKNEHSDTAENTLPDLSEGNDEIIVRWKGSDDPENPLNWPAYKRNGHLGLVVIISFIASFESSIFAPAVNQAMEEFHFTNELLGVFAVSVYVLGFVIGPFLIAPLSELYGRLYVYHTCNILLVIFTIACAVSPSLPSLVGFRLLAGCAGAAPLTIGGGTVADVVPPEKRGRAMAVYVLGIVLGPTIGTLTGGFIAQTKGWRWIFWVVTIISGSLTVLSLIFMRETYAPRILELRAARLRKTTGNSSIRSSMHSGLAPKALFIRAIVRPSKMLIFSPIVLLLSVYTGIAYGYLYLLFTTFTPIFEDQYHFSNGIAGLAYIGLGVGAVLAVITLGIVSDRLMKASASGQRKPERRLVPMVVSTSFIPIGLFWFGWSAKAEAHWIVPIIGSSFVTLGFVGTFLPIQTYLVDAFTIYAASALACNAIVRSIFGAVLPLAGRKMFATLGLGWGASLLAFIALAMVPVSLLFVYNGEYLRKKFHRPL